MRHVFFFSLFQAIDSVIRCYLGLGTEYIASIYEGMMSVFLPGAQCPIPSASNNQEFDPLVSMFNGTHLVQSRSSTANSAGRDSGFFFFASPLLTCFERIVHSVASHMSPNSMTSTFSLLFIYYVSPCTNILLTGPGAGRSRIPPLMEYRSCVRRPGGWRRIAERLFTTTATACHDQRITGKSGFSTRRG